MKPTATIFFFARLGLYLLAFSAPIVHPAIVVPYDRLGWWLWFGVLPAEMLLAFISNTPKLSRRAVIASALLPPIAVAIAAASGLGEILTVFAVAAFAYGSTWFIFHTYAYSRVIATFEPFAPAAIYYRLLRFSRASEEIASAAGALPQALLVIIPAVFLVHAVTLYAVMYASPDAGPGGGSAAASRGSSGAHARVRREIAGLGAGAAALILVVALILPHDYVSHSPITNMLRDPRPERQSLDEHPDGRDNAGADAAEHETMQHGGLEGVPSNRWGEDGGDGGEPDKQYAVMVVASDSGPVYAADAYYSALHPRHGFHQPREKQLNELSRMRLLETWRGDGTASGRGRETNETFFLSTRSERYLQYAPTRVTPTTHSGRFHPFSYEYTAEASAFTDGVGNAHNWRRLRAPSAETKGSLAEYLEVPLSDEQRRVFEQHLERHLGMRRLADLGSQDAGASDASPPRPPGAGALDALDALDALPYHQRIDAILRSFREFQYEAGYDDDVSIAHMVRFLESDRTGDCVEFSHTTAILARLAGIPARVVTGYIAAEELQTPSHRRGLAMIRDRVEPLQAYHPSELYLVTTAHRHAWVQLYLPDYGWVEFETTSHAIPPVGLGDPNLRDVVIPMLEDEPTTTPAPTIPWALLARAAALLLAGGAAAALAYRHLRELYLRRVARAPSARGAEALYRLLLLRLAAGGGVLKGRSETAREFAARVPELHEFAELYERLRYRTRWETAVRAEAHAELWRRYHKALRRALSRGPATRIRSAVSLRGLRYQW